MPVVQTTCLHAPEVRNALFKIIINRENMSKYNAMTASASQCG